MEDKSRNTMTLPVLPLRGMVVFPKAVIHFDVGRKQSIAAVNRAMREEQLIFLFRAEGPGCQRAEADRPVCRRRCGKGRSGAASAR